MKMNDTDSYQNIFNSIEEKKRLFEPSVMTEEQIEEQNIIQSHQLNLEKDNNEPSNENTFFEGDEDDYKYI